MFVGKRSWLRLIFAVRGSVIRVIWKRIAFTAIIATVVTVGHESMDWFEVGLTVTPFSLVGLALSIFLGFRNTTGYDRYWEGRKLWGRLVNTSRSFTRQILLYVKPTGDAPDADQRRLVHLVIAYAHALRVHLRDEPSATLSEYFDDTAALDASTNRPYLVSQCIGEGVENLWREGRVHEMHVPILEGSLTELLDIQGGCERIKTTPIPYTYAVLLHRIVSAYCSTLPFGIVGITGVWTPLVTILIAYAFFGLDAIGEEIEEPFGLEPNDLPLSALSNTIERNLRERLGEPIPAATQPVREILY